LYSIQISVSERQREWLRESYFTRVKNTDKANKPFQFSFSPEKLDVETVMSMDQLKQKIPPALFYKETYFGPNEGRAI